MHSFMSWASKHAHGSEGVWDSKIWPDDIDRDKNLVTKNFVETQKISSFSLPFFSPIYNYITHLEMTVKSKTQVWES